MKKNKKAFVVIFEVLLWPLFLQAIIYCVCELFRPVFNFFFTHMHDFYYDCIRTVSYTHLVDSALAFSGYVAERLPKIKNRLDIFGEQLIMDDRDGILGREENLLSTASFISIGEVFPLVFGFGGVCYPAHVDRPSFSVVANRCV